jgi:hypothetical protein
VPFTATVAPDTGKLSEALVTLPVTFFWANAEVAKRRKINNTGKDLALLGRSFCFIRQRS